MYGESAKKKRDESVTSLYATSSPTNITLSLSFLPCITIKTEFCYQVESVTVTIWWENKMIFPGDGSAALVKKNKKKTKLLHPTNMRDLTAHIVYVFLSLFPAEDWAK